LLFDSFGWIFAESFCSALDVVIDVVFDGMAFLAQVINDDAFVGSRRGVDYTP